MGYWENSYSDAYSTDYIILTVFPGITMSNKLLVIQKSRFIGWVGLFVCNLQYQFQISRALWRRFKRLLCMLIVFSRHYKQQISITFVNYAFTSIKSISNSYDRGNTFGSYFAETKYFYNLQLGYSISRWYVVLIPLLQLPMLFFPEVNLDTQQPIMVL